MATQRLRNSLAGSRPCSSAVLYPAVRQQTCVASHDPVEVKGELSASLKVWTIGVCHLDGLLHATVDSLHCLKEEIEHLYLVFS